MPDQPKTVAGDPCPNGCLASERWEKPPRPEPIVANADGEMYCPTCWDYFGSATQPTTTNA